MLKLRRHSITTCHRPLLSVRDRPTRLRKASSGPHPLRLRERGVPLTTNFTLLCGVYYVTFCCVLHVSLFREALTYACTHARASMALLFTSHQKAEPPHTCLCQPHGGHGYAFRQPIGSKYRLHLLTFTTARGLWLAADCFHYGFQAKYCLCCAAVLNEKMLSHSCPSGTSRVKW